MKVSTLSQLLPNILAVVGDFTPEQELDLSVIKNIIRIQYRTVGSTLLSTKYYWVFKDNTITPFRPTLIQKEDMNEYILGFLEHGFAHRLIARVLDVSEARVVKISRDRAPFNLNPNAKKNQGADEHA